MKHLPEMVRAPARSVTLFMRDHKTGAHRIALSGFRIFSAALANSDTAQRRVSKAAVVLRIFEMSRRVPGMIVGAEAQILVDAIRVDDLAGVHLPVRIPDGFEFAEGLDHS